MQSYSERIQWILSNDIRDSQRRYCESVLRLISVSPLLYPSAAQRSIIDRLYRHEKRIEKEQFAEQLGIAGLV
jgi:hypothetical protein